MIKPPKWYDTVTFVGTPVPSEGLFSGMRLFVREVLEDGLYVTDPHDKHMRWNLPFSDVHIEYR